MPGEKMKAMTILYEVKGALYVNLTNRCNCSCVFCIRRNADCVYDETDSLWLEHEPTFAEVKSAFEKIDLSRFKEIVFCGYGEPTCALEVLLQTANFLKENFSIPLRLNTNGLGSLYNKKNIVPLFENLFDVISISLNSSEKKSYDEISNPEEKKFAFDEMLKFARESRRIAKKIVMTTVDGFISKEDEENCRRICREIGAGYRIREYSAPEK
jgi:TatD family-associated radical SAM protein